jgi:O-antigen/teichoic acid export membrane protein
MTRGRQLLQGSGMRVIQTFVVIVITFLMTPYILHSLESVYRDKDAYYGLWRLVGTFMGYYGMLDLGISSAIGRFLSRAVGQNRPQDEKEVVDTGLMIYIWLSGGVMAVAAFIALLATWIIGEPEMRGIFRILVILGGLNVAISLPFRVFSGILTSRLRFDLVSGSATIIVLVRYGLIWLFLYLGYGLIAMAIVNLAATIAESVAFYLYSRVYGIFDWRSIRLKKERLRELFGYSAFTFVAQIADMLRYQTDNLVITLFRSTALITPYSFPFQLTQYGGQILRSVMGTIGPVFSQDEGRGDFDAIRRKFLMTSKIGTALAVWIYSGMAIHGTDFIRRWIGEDYADITPVLLWLTAAALVTAMQQPSIHLLYAISKHKYYAYANIVEGVLNLLLSIALVGPYGIVGVAMGTALPIFLMRLVVQPIYTCRVIALPLWRYAAEQARALLPAAIFTAAFYGLIRGHIRPDYAVIAGWALLQSAAYLPLVWFTTFSSDERATVLSHTRHPRRAS